jgi:hypothetical protein
MILGTGRHPVRTGPGEQTRVQTTRPQDVGALLLVVGIFLTLFIVSLVLGSPIR